jgi:hypothetical protein
MATGTELDDVAFRVAATIPPNGLEPRFGSVRYAAEGRGQSLRNHFLESGDL